tara:strand:+ start:210 stop:788 length:579 start_codon:yes stop_codon:yes gene_type:complete
MFIHETAIVNIKNNIGKDSKIWHFSHVMDGSTIGEKCTLGQNCFVGENVKIGNNVKIQNNVSIYDGVIIEDNVFIGPSVVFTNVNKPRSEYPTNKKYKSTYVREGSSIGANATIVCGNTLGKYCFVGSGTVVTKDIPNNALVVGNPSRIIGWVGESGERLSIKGDEGFDEVLDHKYSIIYEKNEIKSVEKIQ